MLTKMTQAGGENPFDYVMGLRTSSGSQRTYPPEVIRGDLELFCSMHEMISRKNKDTRLALSYHINDDPTSAEVKCDIDLMERITFPGFREADFLSVWVVHRQKHGDAVRKDAHGIWLRQDLVTGKSYNPYYHRADRYRYAKAKQLLNLIRGYAEPSAPERCRFFGFTYKGTKANEVEEVVKDICESTPINDRDELANALDSRGYRVKRRKSGKARGRKSIAVIFPDGHEVKLVGNPFQQTVEPEFVSVSEDDRLTRIQELIADLNAMCLIVAERNWKRYRAKQGQQKYEQAAAAGFGCDPISLHQLIPANIYEKPKRRTRSPFVRIPGADAGGIPLVVRAVDPADQQLRRSPGSCSDTGATDPNPDEHADVKTSRRLAAAVAKAGDLVGKIHKRLRIAAHEKLNRDRLRWDRNGQGAPRLRC